MAYVASLRRSAAYAALGLPVLGLAWMISRGVMLANPEDARNYRLVYEKPTGWKELPHSPQTLFVYQHPETKVVFRGAANQLVAEINPTPELHSEALADYYVERTRENMPGWTAKKLDGWVESGNTRYKLIRRESPHKIVYTAYSAKGNTTILISMTGEAEGKPAVDRALPDFKEFVASLNLVQTNLQ